MSYRYPTNLYNSLANGYSDSDHEPRIKIEVWYEYHIGTDDDSIIKPPGEEDEHVHSTFFHDRDIIEDSLRFEETIQNGSTLDFMGCISSTFEIKVDSSKIDFNVINDDDIHIDVWIYTNSDIDNEEDYYNMWHVFSGYVDSVKEDNAYESISTIHAYDALHQKLEDLDVTDWYDDIFSETRVPKLIDSEGKMPMGVFRNEFFNKIGIKQATPYIEGGLTNLPFDDIKIKKELDTTKKKSEDEEEYRSTTISAKTVLQSLCQINGVFGSIRPGDMYNKLDRDERAYMYFLMLKSNPSEIVTNTRVVTSDKIETLTFEETEFSNITGVLIFDDTSEEYDEDTGEALVYYPYKEACDSDWAQPFEIRNNFLIYGLGQDIAMNIAKTIYESVVNIKLIPYEMNSRFKGLDLADEILIEVPPTTWKYGAYNNELLKKRVVKTWVMSRSISGLKMIMEDTGAKADDIGSEPQSLNEVITAERFYRRLGDDKIFSEFIQFKDDIELRVTDVEGYVSELILGPDGILARVESLNHDMSAITTEIIMTRNSLSLHAQKIDMVSEELYITAGKYAQIETDLLDIRARQVRFEDSYVEFTSLRDGTTRIHGGCIETGTLTCDKIGFGKIQIGEETYDVDWGWLPPITSFDISYNGTPLRIGWESMKVMTKKTDSDELEEKTINYLVFKDDKQTYSAEGYAVNEVHTNSVLSLEFTKPPQPKNAGE